MARQIRKTQGEKLSSQRPECQFHALPISRLCPPSASVNESLFLAEHSIIHLLQQMTHFGQQHRFLCLNSTTLIRIWGHSLGGQNNRLACGIRVSVWLSVSEGPPPRSLSLCPHVAFLWYVKMFRELHHLVRIQIPKQNLPSS